MEILVSIIIIGLFIFSIIKENKDKKKYEKEKAELEERMRREKKKIDEKINRMLFKNKKSSFDPTGITVVVDNKEIEKNIDMDIKKIIVSSVCGFDTDITLEKFIEQMPNDLNPPEDDEILDYIEEDYIEFDGDEWEITGDKDGVVFNIKTNVDDCGYTKLLKNIFGEEFLMMTSTRFSFQLTQDYNGHINNDLWGTSHNYSQDFVESTIYGNVEIHTWLITKNHYEKEIREIDKTNFLSEEEMNQLKKYDDNYENYERYYDAKYCHYFIKKSEFNKEKWWRGWNDPIE